MNKIILASILLSACTSSSSDTLPTCQELGAPTNVDLPCNRHGECTYDGQQCTNESQPVVYYVCKVRYQCEDTVSELVDPGQTFEEAAQYITVGEADCATEEAANCPSPNWSCKATCAE